mgnify:FL=1
MEIILRKNNNSTGESEKLDRADRADRAVRADRADRADRAVSHSPREVWNNNYHDVSFLCSCIFWSICPRF